MRTYLIAVLALAFSINPLLTSSSRAEYVSIPPPPLPSYDQPAIPGPGYVWVPGNWAYDQASGYFWVPGTWVIPPRPGLLWTPSYWRFNKELNAYGFHKGFWAEEVGFYGGIDYGFGYPGTGYHGGYWRDGRFFYNRAVNNLDGGEVPDAFSEPVSDATNSPVSFLGGLGGINIQITPQQAAVAKLPHVDRTADQNKQVKLAKDDPGSFEKNGGPKIGATKTAGDHGPKVEKGRPRPRHGDKASTGGELVIKAPRGDADKGKSLNSEAITQGKKDGEANNDKSVADEPKGAGEVGGAADKGKSSTDEAKNAGKQEKKQGVEANKARSPADEAKTAGKEGGAANKGKSAASEAKNAGKQQKKQGLEDKQAKSPADEAKTAGEAGNEADRRKSSTDDAKTAAGKQDHKQGGEATKVASPTNSHAEGQQRTANEAKVPHLHLMGERSSGRQEPPPVRSESTQRLTNGATGRSRLGRATAGNATVSRPRQFTAPRVARVASQRATRFTAPRVSRVAPQRVARFSAPRVNRVAAPRINRAAPPKVHRVVSRPAAGRPQRRR